MHQKPIEQKYAKIIARKNTDFYTQQKAIISFVILILLGITIGVAVYDTIYRDRSGNINVIVNYFRNGYINCNSFNDWFSLVINFSKSDIRILLFVFISGFTYFCLLAAGLMTVSEGFLVGFTALYLFEGCSIQSSDINPLCLIFVISKLIICCVITYMGASSYIFSYKFRDIKTNCSILRRASITYRYIFIFVYSLGSILIINFAYTYILFKLLNR